MKTNILRPNFYHIPTIVAEQVNPHEAFVFSTVYWFEKMKDGKCFASNTAIANSLPYKSSASSVANALEKLEKLGFIKRIFKDQNKRTRLEITVLIDYRVSPTDETGFHPQVKGVSPTGEQNSNKNNKKDKTSNPIGLQVNKIIESFEVINENCKNAYSNNTQRKACEFLIEEYGFDEIKRIVEILLPQTNGRAYFPNITTPIQLRDKLATLRNAVQKQQHKVELDKEKFGKVLFT